MKNDTTMTADTARVRALERDLEEARLASLTPAARFHAEHGGDEARVHVGDGLWVYADGAQLIQETDPRCSQLIEPIVPNADRMHPWQYENAKRKAAWLKLLYHRTRYQVAKAAFQERKADLQNLAQRALNTRDTCPPAPLSGAEARRELVELRESLGALRRAFEAAQAEHDQAEPENRRRARDTDTKNREENQALLDAVSDVNA